jgi:hypothetical protein
VQRHIDHRIGSSWACCGCGTRSWLDSRFRDAHAVERNRCGAGSGARDRAAGERLSVATIDRELDGKGPISSNPIARAFDDVACLCQHLTGPRKILTYQTGDSGQRLGALPPDSEHVIELAAAAPRCRRAAGRRRAPNRRGT